MSELRTAQESLFAQTESKIREKGVFMAVNAQFILRPSPGADLNAAIASVREGAGLWRKHGAEVSLWTVSMGEIGNMIFEARFDSYESYARCYDRLTADPAFSTWMQKLTSGGLSTWLRSNLCREILL